MYNNTKNSSRRIFSIKIRDYNKWELKEEIAELLDPKNRNVLQSLGAKLSWEKTAEKVKTFRKNFSVVNPEFVEQIIVDHCKRNKIDYELTK